jgi:alpha/beta superfamily hydrolase
MTPLLFGSADAPLYGVHHAPQAAPQRTGIVLCYPFGQEYMRAHRACRQLAMLLAKKGYHVLRFDYSGTGNSSGDVDSASLPTNSRR